MTTQAKDIALAIVDDVRSELKFQLPTLTSNAECNDGIWSMIFVWGDRESRYIKYCVSSIELKTGIAMREFTARKIVQKIREAL